MRKIINRIIKKGRKQFLLIRINLYLLVIFIVAIYFLLELTSNSIWYKISEAYFSAFIFYFLLNILQDYGIRREALHKIEELTASFVGGTQNLFKLMGNSAEVIFYEDFPSDECISQICKKLTWYSSVPNSTTGLRKANWLEVLTSERKRGLRFISQIKEQNRVLGDMKLESLTTEIKYCNFYQSFIYIKPLVKIDKLRDSELETKAIEEYVKKIISINNYL